MWFQDEARVGLHLPKKRRLTARGIKPKQPFEPLYNYYWLYGAVEPESGESFFVELPRLDSDCFSAYLRELGRAYPETVNVVVLDNAPAHTAKAVQVPANVVLVPLPPYCPELNPVERVWQWVRRRLDVFDESVRRNLDALREHVAEIVRGLSAAQVSSLSGYAYILHVLKAL